MTTFTLPAYYERDPLDETRFVVFPKRFAELGTIRETLYADALHIPEIERRLAVDLDAYTDSVVASLVVDEVRTARVFVRLTAIPGGILITATEASGIAAATGT